MKWETDYLTDILCILMHVQWWRIDNELKEFINSTGASLVAGFDCDVDFIESLALEMIFIDYLSDCKQPYTAYKKITKNHTELCKRTGFIAMQKWTNYKNHINGC